MLLRQPITTGHSADVRMSLVVGDLVLPIGQLGRHFLMLDTAASHPPTNADLIVVIDGEEERRTIHLPDGLKPEVRKTPIAKAV